MKMVILTISLAVCSRAGADQFQLTQGNGGASHYVAYAEVKTGSPLFAGGTDAYGRITINLPDGQYTAVVSVRGQALGQVRLIVDRSPRLKAASLEPLGK